jgi:CHAT domain-containing protein
MPETGRYWLEDAALVYAPSLTSLEALRRRPAALATRDGATLLAFGNPARPAEGEPVPLPDAARQVRQVASFYGAARSATFIGDQARERVFKREAGRYRVLHFATHGTLDDTSPMYSALLMATPDGTDGEDGRLEAREMANVDLSADLVVLSACETGRGRVAPGEGVVGLSWAVLMAGSSRVVVSQWKVDAASTTDLMVRFHRVVAAPRSMVTRPSIAQALRAAALAVMRDPRYRHPFYWSGFILIGRE